MGATQEALVSPNGAITQGADEARTSWYPDQPLLDPATVQTQVKQVFQTTLPLSSGEQVYSQPLVYGNTLFVTTQADDIYALDATTGAVLASRNVATPFNPAALCGDILPTIGINGTPVIDASAGIAYFFAKTSTPAYQFHAVNVNTLVEQPGFPVTIAGTAQNDSSLTFNPMYEHQRTGLLLMNGVVYGGFGSHCDNGPFRGWVVGVSVSGSTKGQIATMFTTEDHTASNGGIWMSGGGLASDATGQILFLTGNGWINGAPLAGNKPPTTLGNSMVRATVNTNGTLTPTQFFAPYAITGDADFAAGGIVLLPSEYSTGAYPDLAIAAGKQGILYVVDRNNLGGYQQSPTVDPNTGTHEDVVVSLTDLNGGLWSKPALWPGEGGWAYITSAGARFQALQYSTTGAPSFTLAGFSSDVFGFGAGSPIVTSNGTNPNTAVMWVSQAGGAGQAAQLRAYAAKPSGGQLTLLNSWNYGNQIKFSTPGVGAGRIYIGSYGTVTGFAAPLSGPVSGPTTNFNNVVLGSSSTVNATITANQALTIPVGGITTSNTVFSVAGATTPALPATLAAGQSITVPIKFAPTAVQAYTEKILVNTNVGQGVTLLAGTGEYNGPLLAVSQTSIAYGTVTTGTSNPIGVVLQNIGSQPLTFNGFTLPAAPYTVSGLPAVGSTLASQASVPVTITFAPQANGTYPTTTFSVQSNSGSSPAGSSSVTLTGAAGPAAKFVLSALTLPYGDIAMQSTETLSFTVTNGGGSDLTILKSKPPPQGVFIATTSLPEGAKLVPGQSVTETVTFTPTLAGSYMDGWIINTSDTATGLKTVQFVGTSDETSPLATTGWTATSTPAGNAPTTNAFDGNLGTAWQSGTPQANGQTFRINMQSPQTFSQVTLNAGNGTDYPHAYSVYVSTDNVNWGSPLATGVGSGQLTVIPLPQTVTAQYLRIDQTGTSSSWWTIAELFVSAANGSGPVTALSRASWVLSYSSTDGEGYTNPIDGSEQTRWSSGVAEAPGQYFQVDLGSVTKFSEITLDAGPNAGDWPAAYSVYTSTDGMTWGNPIAQGMGTSQIQTILFAVQNQRYVRIMQTGTKSNWWSIAEINIYAPLQTSDAGVDSGQEAGVDASVDASADSGATTALMPLARAGWTVSSNPAISGGDATANAVDGSLSTRFSTDTPMASGQYYQVNFGSKQTFSQITLDSAGNAGDAAVSYSVSVSNDGATWGNPIATGTGGVAFLTIPFAQQTAQYVRVTQTGTSTSWWSIAEFNVWAVQSLVQTPISGTHTALSRTGWVATSFPTSGDVAANALDGSETTRCSPDQAQTPWQYFQLNFGSKLTFSQVSLDAGGFAGDYPHGYEVFVSNDGATWGAPIATGLGTTQLVTVQFPTQTAQYVRVYVAGESSSWWSLAEINVLQ